MDAHARSRVMQRAREYFIRIFLDNVTSKKCYISKIPCVYAALRVFGDVTFSDWNAISAKKTAPCVGRAANRDVTGLGFGSYELFAYIGRAYYTCADIQPRRKF